MKILFLLLILVSCGKGLEETLKSKTSAVTLGSIATGASLILDANSLPTGGPCATTSWNDLSGNSITATIVCAGGGGLFGSGIPTDPYRINFNGSSTSVDTNLNAQPDVMPSSTWVAWIRPTASTFSHVISLDDHAGAWNRSLVLNNTGANHFGVFNGASEWDSTSAPTLSGWQFVVVKFSAADISFVKTSSSTSQGSAPTYTPTAQTLTLGRSAGGAFDFYAGDIAWAAVYPRVLTSAEVLSTCLALKDRYSGATCN